MLPKNYSQNKKNKSENHDTAGIVLIIVFSFLLFCNLTGSLILGDIGLVVQNIIMGLIGYSSFPLFVYFIIRGIFLLQNKTLTVKLRNIIFLAVILFCSIIIIQLATTSANISIFGAYIDSVFHSKTIGGVFFGLFAYAFSAFLTSIGAYILLAVIILIALLFICGFFDGTFFGKSLSSNVKSRKVKSKDLTGKSSGVVTYGGDGNDLFIETILPSTQSGVSATFDSLPEDNKHYFTPENNYNDYSVPKYAEEVNAMKKEQDEHFDELMSKAKARQILFGDQDSYMESIGQQSKSSVVKNSYSEKKESSSNSYGDFYGAGSFGLGNYGYSGSELKNNSYNNSYEASRKQQNERNVLDEFIVMPPEKDLSSNYVGGSIINADEQEPEKSETFDFDAIKNSIYEETYGNSNESVKYENKIQDNYSESVNRNPIINADYVEKQENTSEKTIAASVPEPPVQRAPIIIGSSVMADEPYIKNDKEVEKEPEEKAFQAQIIRASSYDADVDEIERKAKASLDAAKDAAKKDKDAEKDNEFYNRTQTNFEYSAIKTTDKNNEVADKKSYVTSKIVLPDNNKSFGDISSEEHSEYSFDKEEHDDVGLPVTNYTEEEIVESEPEEIVDEEMLISEDFDENDIISDAEDDDLNNEEYMNIYGHPKFVQVSDEEAKELSDKFEKSSDSFNFEEETIDASENTKIAGVSDMSKAKVQDNLSIVSANLSSSEKNKNEIEKPKPKKPYKYHAPSLDLLVTESTIPVIDPEAYEEKKNLLEETLENLGIPAKVVDITVGPSVTRYELNMPVGMSVKKIENCEQDIRYGLACKNKIRIESPIPGKKAVGIEVPNDKNALVALKDIIGSKEFKSSLSPLTIALGKDIQGKVMVTTIEGMPHLLIAGTTGSGKSACLNSLIISLLYKSSPEDVKLILVDPKRVEFTAYSGLPHMMIKDAITEPAQVMNAFKWAKEEMERRYKVLQSNRVRNIKEYNNLEGVKNRTLDKMPFLVVIVDEFADLMISSGTDKKRELENLISSIAGKARAAGIHLILATQRPSAEIITGTIKSNLPCSIAFAVSNQTNSRIILDRVGAESLLGKGDMLYAPQDKPDVIRIQGAYIENDEVLNIVDQIKENNVCEFDDEFEKAIVASKDEEKNSNDDDESAMDLGYDRDLADIVRMVIKTGQASGAMIQRRFAIGYMRSAKIIDQMEKFNFIGPANGSKPREVYITKERFKEFFGEEFDN